MFVRADRLVDDLWAADAVKTRRNTLQSKVARLRRALGDPSAIASGDGGYKLAVEPAAVDALAVLRDAAAAARAARRRRRPRRRRAERLGAGAVPRATCCRRRGDWAAPHRARLDEARMKLVETRFAAAAAARGAT